MNQFLKNYLSEGKTLYLTANDKGTKWSAWYIGERGELNKVWISDFMTESERATINEFDTMGTWDKRDKFYKKIGSRIAYARVAQKMPADFFYFQCNAYGTSRPLEILLSIQSALKIEGVQNYKVL